MQGPAVPVSTYAVSQRKSSSKERDGPRASSKPGTHLFVTRAMNIIAEPEHLPLGVSLPPGDPHVRAFFRMVAYASLEVVLISFQGISVHLPKWADTVGWASREPRVLEAMKTGYPRFFISRVVERLAVRLLQIQRARAASAGGGEDPEIAQTGQRLAMLLTSVPHARICRKVLPLWNSQEKQSKCCGDSKVYIVAWNGDITAVGEEDVAENAEPTTRIGNEDVILVSYPAELAVEAKSFWQHTGFGISSRRATHWLESAPFLASNVPSIVPSPGEIPCTVNEARATLKTRIAAGHSHPSANIHVSPSDVFLFPTGMTAIAEIATAIKSLRTPTLETPYRVAVFGFVPHPSSPGPRHPGLLELTN